MVFVVIIVYIDEVADNDDDNTEYLASQHELILSSVMSFFTRIDCK